MTTPFTLHRGPLNPANRLGLLYRLEAARLPWTGPIWDVHTHIADLESARKFFGVADLFGIQRVWTMTQLEQVDALRAEFGDRLDFIAVPNYDARNDPDTFTTNWLRRIEGFAAKGCRICKFWAAPRGVDFHPDALRLDSPIRIQAMKLARSLGMIFMTHVGDPDTWYATKYRDAHRYGTKREHHQILERVLDQFHDVPWIAAHMAGDPEHLDHLQDLLDRHPNLYVDTSATKWMIRELSKHPDDFRRFCRRNPGRVLFGSDIVVSPTDRSFDLIASRYWALRTFLETRYDGPSPIVDPDLAMVDPTLPPDSTAQIRGADLDPATLAAIYHHAAQQLLLRHPQPRKLDSTVKTPLSMK